MLANTWWPFIQNNLNFTLQYSRISASTLAQNIADLEVPNEVSQIDLFSQHSKVKLSDYGFWVIDLFSQYSKVSAQSYLTTV
jgi:hypothetical protein